MGPIYDAVVIGAGHNGLTAAALLAGAGRSVLVLERQSFVGGCTSTREFHPGFRVDRYAHRTGPLDERVLRQLGLERRGIELVRPDPATVGLDGERALTFFRSTQRTAEAIAQLSPEDARRWPLFCQRISAAVRVVDRLRRDPPPDLPGAAPGDLLPLLRLGIALRVLGRKEMVEVMRLLSLSAAELLGEWFETPLLQGALAALAVSGSMQGPYGGGTAYGLLHFLARGEDPGCGVTLVRGGIGRLPELLAEVARNHGAEIRLRAEVRSIVPSPQGLEVVLGGGEVIRAKTVISTLDPRRTLADLCQDCIEPGLVKQVLHLGFQGVAAKVHLALDRLPEFPVLNGRSEYLHGALRIAPSLEYVERAYDDAKYGAVSRHPIFEVVIPTLADPGLAPPGRHVMSVLVQYVPYRLAEEPSLPSQGSRKAQVPPVRRLGAGGWTEARREALGDLVVQRLAEHLPHLPGLILAREVVTPADLERELALTAGDIFQGQLRLDQLWFLRPIPGWARYRLPISGLYLGGAGAHPGGGVMGTAGYLAARTVLHDLRHRRDR